MSLISDLGVMDAWAIYAQFNQAKLDGKLQTIQAQTDYIKAQTDFAWATKKDKPEDEVTKKDKNHDKWLIVAGVVGVGLIFYLTLK